MTKPEPQRLAITAEDAVLFMRHGTPLAVEHAPSQHEQGSHGNWARGGGSGGGSGDGKKKSGRSSGKKKKPAGAKPAAQSKAQREFKEALAEYNKHATFKVGMDVDKVKAAKKRVDAAKKQLDALGIEPEGAKEKREASRREQESLKAQLDSAFGQRERTMAKQKPYLEAIGKAADAPSRKAAIDKALASGVPRELVQRAVKGTFGKHGLEQKPKGKPKRDPNQPVSPEMSDAFDDMADAAHGGDKAAVIAHAKKLLQMGARIEQVNLELSSYGMKVSPKRRS